MSETKHAKIEIKTVDMNSIVRAKYNPRVALQAGDPDYEKILKSINGFGYADPLILNSHNNVLISGHQRLSILEALGYTTVDVSIVNITDEKKEKAMNLGMNKIVGRWDEAKIRDILMEFDVYDEYAKLAGFEEEEFDLMKSFEENVVVGEREGEDDAPPLNQEISKTKTGDIFILGNHRLMCGDSANAEHVNILMDGQKAGLVNTDPPYGISFVKNSQSKNQSGGYADIENDELDGKKLQEFLESIIRCSLPHLTANPAFYLWHPMLTQGVFFAAAAAAAADILIHRQIIWVKPSLVFGRGDYHWRHELCFYGWIKGSRPAFYGERNQTTIWEVGRENDGIHPTQKPVALFDVPILNHLKKDEISYEPFAGSGSQFISAEKYKRRCYGMEISPNYCDVIVARWENFTEKKAELIRP